MANNNFFTLSFPNTWKETTIYTFDGPSINGFQHSLILMIDKNYNANTDINSYVQKHLSDARKTMPGFTIISETETRFHDATPVYIVIYQYSPAENIQFFQKQYYIQKKNGMYIFNSTFTHETIKTVVNDVDQIVYSLSVPDEISVMNMQ